jgi:hypothetical protein
VGYGLEGALKFGFYETFKGLFKSLTPSQFVNFLMASVVAGGVASVVLVRWSNTYYAYEWRLEIDMLFTDLVRANLTFFYLSKIRLECCLKLFTASWMIPHVTLLHSVSPQCPMEEARIKMVGDASWAKENVVTGILRLVRENGLFSTFGGLPAMLSKQVVAIVSDF